MTKFLQRYNLRLKLFDNGNLFFLNNPQFLHPNSHVFLRFDKNYPPNISPKDGRCSLKPSFIKVISLKRSIFKYSSNNLSSSFLIIALATRSTSAGGIL